MKNYRNSDYALNRYSEGIVYRFADEIVEVSLADYLIENPNKTADDFRALKELSDADYFSRDRAENAQTKLNISINGIEEIVCFGEPSVEELLYGEFTAIDEAEKHNQYLELMRLVLSRLTDTQRRRYLLYVVAGLNEREIAEIEGSTQQAISKSLHWVEQKIKKILNSTKK